MYKAKPTEDKIVNFKIRYSNEYFLISSIIGDISRFWLSYLGLWGRRGRDSMVVGFNTTYIQSVPITTNVVSSNPAQARYTR